MTARRGAILCHERQDCADRNPNRWHCMRGHDGTGAETCPLVICERHGANRKPEVTP